MEASNPYAAPASEVRDIIPPEEAVQLAGRLERLGAYILDALIGGVMVYLPAIVIVGPASLVGILQNPQTANTSAFMGGLGAAVVGLLVWLGITIHLVRKNGQTIGKRILDIKVARKDGSRASLGRIFWMRNVIIVLLSAIPFVGFVVALLDNLLIFRASRQCLHDQIADTIVIAA